MLQKHVQSLEILSSHYRTPTSCLPLSNRKELGESLTWIRSHFVEHGDVCTPKAEVYDEYK